MRKEGGKKKRIMKKNKDVDLIHKQISRVTWYQAGRIV